MSPSSSEHFFHPPSLKKGIHQPRLELIDATTLASMHRQAHHSNVVFFGRFLSKFLERRTREVRRVLLPRTPVNSVGYPDIHLVRRTRKGHRRE